MPPDGLAPDVQHLRECEEKKREGRNRCIGHCEEEYPADMKSISPE
jgi:hypothetical protein